MRVAVPSPDSVRRVASWPAVSAAPIVMIGILVMSIRMLIQIASTASLRPRIKPESGERNFIIAFRMASVGNVCKSNLPRFYSIQLEYAHFRQTFDVLQ